MRGTFKGIEVKRRGGEQAHRRVGSLKLLQDLDNIQSALRPAPAPIFFVTFLAKSPTNEFSTKRVLFL